MSLNVADFRKATTEALRSDADPADILEALCVINRRLAHFEASQRQQALACGRRADSIAKIEGLTETLTSVLRMFAACAVVRHQDVEDLYRHVSAIRKWLKAKAPAIEIRTVAGEGYELVSGFDDLYRILHVAKTPSLAAPGFTVKQTAILTLISARGSAHVDQIPCLQRHMSNIRKRLPKGIEIETRAGEGLYVLKRGGEALKRLLSGEPMPEPKAKHEEAALLAA